MDFQAAPGALTDPEPERVANWASKPESPAYEAAGKLYKLVQTAFDNKDQQSEAIKEYWSIYYAEPDENLQYAGNSQGYVPVVRDCINARTKRAIKQLFPANHKHVEGMASDARTPFTQLALLEHYIRKTRLRHIVAVDLIAGDVTGQWCLMIDWSASKRTITRLAKKNAALADTEGSDLGLEDPLTQEEEEEEEEIIEEGIEVIPFATEDLAVIPPTEPNLQRAKAVAVRLRLSVEKVEELAAEGVFILPDDTSAEDLCRPNDSRDRYNPPKSKLKKVGVKTQGTDKHAIIYCVYTKLDLGGEHKEEAIIYYADQNLKLGIIKNPLWSGKRPLISAPVEPVEGSFWGKSKIEPVKFMQWQLVDMHNMAQDSAMYSVLPVFAADPVSNPNWATMVMGLGAVWPIAPDGIKPLTPPALWKDAAANVEGLKRQIWESMDVNEMMMGKMPQGRKNNALMGQMQQEQQTNVVDHAQRYEELVLDPLMEMFFEFDQQYRTENLMVETRGEIGAKAKIEKIEPQQWDERFFFRWAGTEFMLGMQRMQQQIATMNVLKGVPPQMLNGRKLDVTPIMETLVENVFGPELGPKILVDERHLFSVPPEVEDEAMHNGLEMPVHEADDDIKHLQAHMRAAGINGDPLALYKTHMQKHMEQLQNKRMRAGGAQPMGQAAPGAPGSPGGAGPGVPGAPRPGAMPAEGRPMQQPPGAIGQDAMLGAPGRG